MKLNLFFLIFSLFISIPINAFDFNFGMKSIYGVDDRKETNEYQGQLEAIQARSVAVQIKNERTILVNGSYKILKPESLKAKFKLCANQNFGEQISVGSCTGFLVAPDIIITAGHCMNTISDCQNSKWYFDFTDKKTKFKKEDVYSCHKILKTEKVKNRSRHIDYSIIKLDRPVKNRVPLEYRESGSIPPLSPVYTIGHPSGLPQKITGNARVIDADNDHDKNLDPFLDSAVEKEFFTTTLDTFGGNSGSPVFNYMTGLVEAVLVSGNEDYQEGFTEDGVECSKTAHYKDDGHEANERAIRITKIPISEYIR
ncbi:MAG: serine protease [Alphaproteobacteria bacterium]|nr:MAG: serine protease [Alphaproteobacteria bacterium]